MPRFISSPSLFDRLPGEVVLLIARNFFESRPRDKQSLKDFIRITIPFQHLSWKFKLAIDMVIGVHFHTFSYPRHHGVHDDTAPWHVNTRDGLLVHRDYWSFYQGSDAVRIPVFGDIVNTLTIYRTTTLRSVSLDIRALEPISRSSLRLWKTLHAPRWVQTSMILTRIATSSFGIEELNLRVSPQQDLLDIVSDIVNRNKRLRIVRIDVNSTVVSNRNISPTIRLDRMFGCYKARVPLERFILRAPGCNIKTFATSKQQQANFFKHLRCVQEFVMACHVFNALLPTMIWTYHLLRHMPKLEFGDVAVYAPDSHTTSMSDVDLPLLHMHSLEKLSIQIPEVDTHFLRSINALCLFKLRIKSSVPVELWPACVDNHFPNLFIANVMCPGPSAPRIRALGVPERSFYQNLGNMHNHVRPHNQPFLAYIKPYGRRRQEQPPALTMNTQPYPLPEASDMGWDEEDSEASVTTGSDYSDSEEEDAADSPTPDVSQYSDDSTLTELTDTEQGTSSEPEMDWDEDVDDNEGDDDEEDPDYIPTSPTSELLNTSQIEPAMSAPEEVGTEPALASGSSSTLTSLAAEAAPTSPPSKRARLSLT